MRRSALIAAAIGGLIASNSFAGFIFSQVATPTANGNVRFNIYALNDGQAVGTAIPAGTTKVQAIQFSSENFVTPGTFKFRFAAGGANVNLFNNRGEPNDDGEGNLTPNNQSSLYLAAAATDNTYQNVSFNPAVVTSANAAAVTSFTTDLAATSNAPLATIAQNLGRGALVASLVVSPGATGTVTGNIAAEQGVAVPYTFAFGIVNVPEPTTLAALAGAAGLGMIRRRK